ncbi:catalase-domain-containing protein [Aulographum hederae CBS 113979]|uniref:Catalase-domain-containing protein n=1 Tax=Aulographum hederae CBS 113979 TaxID=1176131 RepID=A0A6G1GQW0_9PEZI|nr:catalase-domain-containing protein [Aulographum hederae CBS 113979]
MISKSQTPFYTLSEGRPLPSATTHLQVSATSNKTTGGLLTLNNTALIETLAHFSRERIPERVVHARAAGAFGEFEVTHDVSDLTDAAFLTGVGKKSRTLLRVSTVGGESGSADCVRDVRGWASKIYTEEGNQDFVFNDMPMFFIRDPIKFPSVNRSHKRDPRTHLPSPAMFWDFHTAHQEGIHALMFLFSDRGTPASIRHLNSYSGHTYKFTKADGSWRYVKFHFKTEDGIKTNTDAQATKLAGENPNALTQDLFEAIERKEYPTWKLYVQVMEPEDAETYRWNPFDMTKVWPHADYPLRPVGKLTLNENPQNYFTSIEQAAFSPSTMVRGIAPSADPMLQARMFAYPDAARYRLGANYTMLPSNRPVSEVYSPYQRDGAMNFSANYGGDPNYFGATMRDVAFVASDSDYDFQTEEKMSVEMQEKYVKHEQWAGRVAAFSSEVTDEDFVQAMAFWEVLGRQEGQQEHFIHNVSVHVAGVEVDGIRERVFEMFGRVDKGLGRHVRNVVDGLRMGRE